MRLGFFVRTGVENSSRSMVTGEPQGVIHSSIRISSGRQHPDSWGTPGCNPTANSVSDSVVRVERIPLRINRNFQKSFFFSE